MQGTHHNLFPPILISGIVYEDGGQYEISYKHFRKNYDIQLEVLGPDHIRTVRARNILKEPMYRRIAQRLGEEIPD